MLEPTNPVPYTLPDNKTRMVFRSKSYKPSGNNEMTFEDLTGAENQFFTASKDQTINQRDHKRCIHPTLKFDA